MIKTNRLNLAAAVFVSSTAFSQAQSPTDDPIPVTVALDQEYL